MPDEPGPTTSAWCEGGGVLGRLRRPVTEEWLIAHEFRIETGRNDPRMPIRSLAIGPRVFLGSSDDLCIDVAPQRDGEWHVWIGRREPYRHIHVRMMRYTHELIQLYEGLTGQLWPGSY